jgi:TPR repeat protein
MKMLHGSVDAIVDMGKMYIEGYVIPRDYKKAYELLLSASRLGNSEATSILLQLEESYYDEIK